MKLDYNSNIIFENNFVTNYSLHNSYKFNTEPLNNFLYYDEDNSYWTEITQDISKDELFLMLYCVYGVELCKNSIIPDLIKEGLI